MVVFVLSLTGHFSSLAGLEVAEKFVVVVGVGNTWLLCLSPTLVALELL